MSFGWSAGDIALALTVLHDIVQALHPKDGAAGNYRTTVAFLNEVIRTLQPLRILAEKGSLQPYETELRNGVEAIRNPVEEFLDAIQKYESSLGKDSSKRLFRGAGRKLQWHYSMTPKATALQKKIGGHLTNLNVVIQLLLANKVDEIPERVRTVFTPEFESLRVILSENTLLSQKSQLSRESLALLEINLTSSIQAIEQDSEICTLILQGHKSRTKATLNKMLEIVQEARGSTESRCAKSTAPLPLSNLTIVHRDSAVGDLSWETVQPWASEIKVPLPQSRLNSHHEVPAVKNIILEAENFEALAPFIEDFTGWLQNPFSPLLWLQGPIDGDFTSLATASVLITARAAEIPTISFFCEQEIEQSTAIVNGVELLKRLTNSFINELSSMSSISVSEIGIESANYLPRSLDVIKRLLTSRKQKGLIILIDGYHLLDDSSTPESSGLARKLLSILEETDPATTKILLCTSGLRSFLLDVIPGHRRQDEIDHIGNDYQPLVEALKEVSLDYLK